MVKSSFPKIFEGQFYTILFFLLAILLFSYIGYLIPIINIFIFFLLIILFFIIAFKNFNWGLIFIFAELFLGSKGYLFSILIGDFRLSLRLVLFVSIFIIFLIRLIKKKNFNFIFLIDKWYYCLFFFFFLGGIIGLFSGHTIKNIFLDINGYFYFALLFCLVNKNKKEIKYFFSKILKLLFASSLVISFYTIFSLIFFSLQVSGINFYYKWIRDNGIGEITYVSGNFWRIFWQSQIYCLIALIMAIGIFVLGKKIINVKEKIGLLIVIFFNSFTILLSFSRSFWVGGVCAFLFFLTFLLWSKKINLLSFGKILLISGLIILTQIGLMYPFFNFGRLVEKRITDSSLEAAGSSRLNQLKPLISAIVKHPLIGSGFATDVSYVSNDPRHREMYQDGVVTTYSFEWGYLDIILKLGLIGFFVYLLIILKIFRKIFIAVKNENLTSQKIFQISAIFALLAICIVNIFSPYLNHPLGIGWLILTQMLFI